MNNETNNTTPAIVAPDGIHGWVVANGFTGEIVSRNYLGRIVAFANRETAESWIRNDDRFHLSN